MTITNKKSRPIAAIQEGDKIIDHAMSGGMAVVLCRAMNLPRRHNGRTHYDMAYWAVAPSEEEEA